MFTAQQKRILIGCIIAYTSAYIGRLNLAQALPAIGAALSLSNTALGTLQTVFAVTYAAGQLIVGTLADKHRPDRFLHIGLLGTSICNLLFGLVSDYRLLLALWMLNGVSQSMLWTPIVKTVADRFEGAARARAAFIMSAVPIAGHLMAWLVSGTMVALFGWRFSFIIPAAVLLVALIASKVLVVTPESHKAEITKRQQSAMPIRTLLFGTGLWALLLCCIALGYVRDGITTWAPSVIVQTLSLGEGSQMVSLIIPVLNIFGWAISQACFKKLHGRARITETVFLLMGAAVVLLMRLFGASNGLALPLLMGIACAVMYGSAPLLTAQAPLEYEPVRRVALVAGMIDCLIYCGSALAGVVNGWMSDVYGWNIVFVVWVGVLLIGALMAAISSRSKIVKED
ncbi:MAG: MFS transporter [Clostridia bacterium]|nr:MFS transporter [Clostridia bacterium]